MRTRCLLLLVATGFALASRGAFAAVDPFSLESIGNLVVSPEQAVGQTIVMRLGGRLTGIEFAPLGDTADPGDQIVLEVFDGAGQSIGSLAITAAGFPPGAGSIPAPLTLDNAGPGFFDLTPLSIEVSEHDSLSFELRKGRLAGWIVAGGICCKEAEIHRRNKLFNK